jgi:hypothetical protein
MGFYVRVRLVLRIMACKTLPICGGKESIWIVAQKRTVPFTSEASSILFLMLGRTKLKLLGLRFRNISIGLIPMRSPTG